MSSQVPTALRRGVLSGILGIVIALGGSSQGWSNPQPEEASLWTFTVDQCTDDDHEPRTQRILPSSLGRTRQRTADKGCQGKRSQSAYQVFSQSEFEAAPLMSRRPWRPPVKRPTEHETVNHDSGTVTESVNITEQNEGIREVQIQALPRTIHFQYTRSNNCCSFIELVPEQRGQVLEVRERELPSSSVCRCSCAQMAEGTMRDLEPGIYTLRVFSSPGYWSRQDGERVWIEEQEEVLFAGTVIVQ